MSVPHRTQEAAGSSPASSIAQEAPLGGFSCVPTRAELTARQRRSSEMCAHLWPIISRRASSRPPCISASSSGVGTSRPMVREDGFSEGCRATPIQVLDEVAQD